MFWVFFRMDDTKYPNLKKVVYNDFNPLNYNLFKNVRGSNYESFGKLLLEEDCQGYKDEYDVTTVDDLTNKFKSYQKEIFAPDFKITEENSQDVAKKYAFVLTQVFSGTMPEKGKYMNFKGQYKPKFRTFREKLTTDKYDSFQKKLEKITFCDLRHDVKEIYALSDITYALKIEPEAFGRTVIESIQMKTPVIGWDIGVVAESLKQLFPYGLVPLKDEATLLEKTKEILSGQSIKMNSNPFTKDKMLSETLAVYKAMLRQQAMEKVDA